MSTIIFDFRHYYRKGERRESDQIAYQWDLGHVAEIYVPVNATYEIHYCFADFTETDDYAVESITAAEDGGYKLTAHIPNELFERSGELKVYVIGADDNHVLTTYEGYITIRGRAKPEDYVDDDPENEATRILTGAREARDAAIEAAEQAEAAASQSAAQASIAEVYDATKTYAIGDYCLHDGQLYECTTEITTPEAWTAAHWTAATVGTELNDIKGDVTGLKEDLNNSVKGLNVIDTPPKINLLDSNTTIIINEKWWNYQTKVVEDKNGMSVAYIKVKPSVIYAYLANVSLYGSAASRLPTFDKDFNYIEYKYGTLDSPTNIVDIRNFNDTAVYVLYPFATANPNCFFAVGEFDTVPNFSYSLNERIKISDGQLQEEYVKKSVTSPISPISEGYATKAKDSDGFYIYSGKDNTAGIQSTINKIVSDQKTGCVYIPNGIYTITSPIVIDSKSLVLDGESWNYPDHPNGVIPSKNGTVLRLNSYNICGIQFVSGNGLGIYNLGINGSDWNTSGKFDRSNPLKGSAIYQSGTYSDQIELRRLNVNGLAVAFCASNSDGILKQVDAASIHDCNMDGSGSGILLDGVSCIYSKIYNNLIADTPCYGVFLSGQNRGVSIKGNTFVRNGGKFSVAQKASFESEGIYTVYVANATRCIIEQNIIHDAGCFYNVTDEQNAYYEYDTDASGLYINGDQCVITGNSIYMSENHSAVINGSMHSITGNLFRDKRNGLILGCSTSIFTGNKVLTAGDYSMTVSGNYNTIMANAIEKKVKVTGNYNCFICSGRYETVEIEEGATGNLLIGYAQGQITDHGTNTIIR